MRPFPSTLVILLAVQAPAAYPVDQAPAPRSSESIVSQALPAVVAIRAESDSVISAGSGFIVDPNGKVVTNLHVIRDANRVAIKLHTGEIFDDVRIVGFDKRRDLAILKFAGFQLPTLPLGNSEDVQPGQHVLAIGHPLGLEDSVKVS